VPWLILMCHDASICAMTHSYVPRRSHMCQDDFICAMPHPYLSYGVATISRLLKNCRSLSQNIVSFIWLFSKETYDFMEPTNLSHTIAQWFIHMFQDSFLCAMAHLYVPQFIHMCHGLLWRIHICYDASICVMIRLHVLWLIHMCHLESMLVMTQWHIHMCHDAFTCARMHSYVSWRIQMCHASCTCAVMHSDVPWLIHV